MTLNHPAPVTDVPRTGFPLTAAQREIWMADQATDDPTAYSTALVAHSRGRLDLPILTAAIEATIARSEAARVRIAAVPGGEVVQEFIGEPIECPVVDFRQESDPAAAARAWIDTELDRAYDTATGPLIRTCLLLLADDHTLAYLSAHHLVLDGTGVGMLLSSALTRYGRDLDTGAAAEPATTDTEPNAAWTLDTLVAADRDYRESAQFALDRRFWLDQIADAPPPPRLLAVAPGAARRADIVPVALTADEGTALYGLSRPLGVRTAGLLMATLAGLLHRRTGSHDLLLATPMSARLTPELRAHIGTLATVLPVRVRLRAGATWAQVAGDVDETLRAVNPHSRFRGEDLHRALREAGTPRRLFGVGANVLPMNTRAFAAVGLDAELEILSSGPTGDIDVFFEVDAAARSVAVALHGPGEQRAEIEEIADDFASFLRTLIADPDTVIGPPLPDPRTLSAEPDPAPLAGTFPGTEQWAENHDELPDDNLATAGAATSGAADAVVFTVPIPPRSTAAQLNAVLDAVLAAHPELSLRAECLAPGLWEYVRAEPGRDEPAPGGIAFTASLPARGAAPGTLTITAHPLVVDAAGRTRLSRDLAAAWAAIAAGEPIDLPAADDPEQLIARYAERALDPDVLAGLDGWRALTPAMATEATTAATTAPGAAAAHSRIAALTPEDFRAAGLDATGASLAALALTLGRLHPDGPAPVVALAPAERAGHWSGGGTSTLPLDADVPLRLPVTDDPATALRAARELLRGLPDGGSGYGLLRYLHPQAGPTLAAVAGDLRLEVRDERGLTVIAPGRPARTGPCAVICFGDDGVTASLTGELPGGHTAADAAAALAAAFADLVETAADPALRAGPTARDVVGVTLGEGELARLAAAAPAPITAVWGLSPLQSGLYFQSAVSGDLDVYNAQFVLSFDRPLDPVRLRRALTALMAEHPPLRSAFTHADLPAPVQFIVESPAPPLHSVDLTGLSAAELADAEQAAIEADRARPFDAATPPLWRVTHLRRPDGDKLVVSRRFLVWDGWSNGVFIDGLLTHYAGGANAPATSEVGEPVFARYLRWLAEQDRGAAVAAWTAHLDGYTEPALLRPGADPVVRGGTRVDRRRLDEQATAGLTATAQRLGVTLNTVLTSAVTLLTGRWSGRTDVAIGQTVAGRPSEVAGADGAIGMFLNTVPLRTELAPQTRVREFLPQQQRRRLDLLGHEWLSLGEITAATGTPALFDVLLVLQNFIGDEQLGAEHGVTGHVSDDHTHFPLTLVVTPGRELTVTVETRSDLIDDAAARGLADDLLALLAALARPETDDLPLAALPFTAAEQPMHGRALAVPELSVSELLAETAARMPEAPALVCPSGPGAPAAGTTLTFGELDARINALARLLLAAGAGPETVVALAIERSAEMVVALFAVLRTGAAYLPLELVHPAPRLNGLARNARPVLVLTAGAPPETVAQIVDGTGASAVDLRDEATAARLTATDPGPLRDAELGAFARTRPGRLDHPAYLIYTSGSTGTPKGVVTGYRGLTNMYLNHEDEIFRPTVALARRRDPARERLAIAHTVSFAFDMSWEELLWLTYGHTVHVCDEDLRRDPEALVRYCRAHRIDLVNVTPTYAEYLIAAGLLDDSGDRPVPGDDTVPATPELVLLGGEAVSTGVWETLREAPDLLGYNLYGPTEYTINTLGGGTADSATPTVGRPISNTVAHLLDPWLRPVPPGVAGELYVEGMGLARGYHSKPGQTAASFVAHPDAPGRRLYRTGDLMRRRADGLLDYLGRTDFQIKVRGYRVEPAEIEAALTALDGITHAVVVAHGRALAAYLVTEGTGPADSAIRRALGEALPSYMVPSSFTRIDAIPVTVNGKRDVAALPAPARDTAGGSRAGSLLERVLAELAAETLGLPSVDVDADLFDLGAHSMQLMSFAAAVRARLGVTLAVADVFTSPTIAGIAAVLDGDPDAASRLRAPVIGFRTGAAGGAAPVVVLPPGTGLGWRYGQLLPYLPADRDLYAVQSPQITAEQTTAAPDIATDPAEVARWFAERILEAVPDGPVVLLGWSFGGSLAPTVAAELAGRGRPVESLILLDAFAQSPAEYYAYLDSLSPDAAALGALDVPVPPELAADLTREQAVALVAESTTVFAGLDAELVAAVLDSSSWSLAVMRELPAEPVPVSVPVFYVEAEPAGSLATWGAALAPAVTLSAGWPHGGLLGPDAVAFWGPALTEFLQEQ